MAQEEHRVEYKDFLQTMPRDTYITILEEAPGECAQLAQDISQITLDDSLIGRRIVLLQRFPQAPELRMYSELTVKDVTRQIRNLAGVLQNMVSLERRDGTLCEIGLCMASYWQRENNDMDFVWFVRNTEDESTEYVLPVRLC